MKKENKIIIFTDGSSRGNPGPGGWGAVVVLEGEGKVHELGGRENHTTNNKMELKAAIEGLNMTKVTRDEQRDSNKIEIYTDSSYLINGITKWVQGWQKKGWITSAKEEVLNKDLWEELIKAAEGRNIEWKYVGGHRGIAGNEKCDEIATQFADGAKPQLFNGRIDEYPVNILNFNLDEQKSEKRSKDRIRMKASAHSYISVVGNKLMTHKSWAECEERVKGIKGAKFKKTINAEDEISIKKDWGF
jgi:ribonuclease HI